MDVNDLEDLVRSNIQEVLAAVASEQHPEEAISCPVPPVAPVSSQAPQSCLPCTQSAQLSASGRIDVSLLEVPQNEEATVRLLKARIKSLEEQLNMATQASQEKNMELADLQKQAKLFVQKETAANKEKKSLEAQVELHRKAAEAARDALAAKDQQVKELTREGAKADKDRRAVEQESRARDVRLQRALEEVDKYKQLLQDIKLQGREVKDVARSEHSRAISEVKRLERHRGELMVVLRKQAKLIDVLRRQRAHLEAARLLAFTEDEFMRLLDVGAR